MCRHICLDMTIISFYFSQLMKLTKISLQTRKVMEVMKNDASTDDEDDIDNTEDDYRSDDIGMMMILVVIAHAH